MISFARPAVVAIALLASTAPSATERLNAARQRAGAREFDTAWAALETVKHVRAVQWLGINPDIPRQALDPGPWLTMEHQSPDRWRLTTRAGCIGAEEIKIGSGPWESVLTASWAPRIAAIFPRGSIVGDDEIVALRGGQRDGHAVNILELSGTREGAPLHRTLIIDSALGLPVRMIERNPGMADVTTDFDYATPVKIEASAGS